jgi:hypothetical protein
MIQAMIESLQALAAPAEVQCARFPDFVVKTDELVLDFDDALMLVRDCRQLALTGHQQDALADLDLTLSAMSGSQHGHLWTEAALREGPEWEVIRRQAAAALRALDAPVVHPPPSRAVYVPSSPPDPSAT